MNEEFQRIARGDKKAFLSNQCKEIEETNRVEKTRDLVKKLEIPRDNFMQRWLDKERNSMDLTEAEDIKKWQEFT